MSNSASTSASDIIKSYSDRCEYDSIILTFYLENGSIHGKTLEELSEIRRRELCSYWKDDLVNVYILFVYLINK